MPLVAGEFGPQPNNAVLATVRAGVLGGAHRVFGLGCALAGQPLGAQVQALALSGLRPGAVAHPAPANMRHAGARARYVHDVGAKRRLLLHARGRVFEPAVPPAQRFLQKADARLGHRKVRVLVRPGPDDALDRRLYRAHQAWHGIGIGVVPAAHGQYGGLDGTDVFIDRAALPVGVAVRVLKPVDGQQGPGLQALQPHGAPGFAHQRRVWRARGVAKHGGRPAHVFREQAAAFEVNVVGVAVVGRAQRNDGLQALGLARRHLQTIKAAPGDTHHADAPGTPWLRTQPGDDRFGVLQLLLGVLVVHQALRVAIAAHVHTDAGVAVAGQVGVREGVAHDGAVALAVGQVLQDGRYRVFGRVLGQPDARR